ncbi:MAG: hypothetical protein Q8P82_01470 [bacterium]|nr:hypothetical protein [bacterium]
MNSDDLNKVVTVGILKETLGEFTEDVLMPAIRDIVKEEVRDVVTKEIGSAKSELKDYVDTKISSLRGDLISVIRGERDRDQTFKEKMLEVLKRNKLASEEELSFMAELVR